MKGKIGKGSLENNLLLIIIISKLSNKNKHAICLFKQIL